MIEIATTALKRLVSWFGTWHSVHRVFCCRIFLSGLGGAKVDDADDLPTIAPRPTTNPFC